MKPTAPGSLFIIFAFAIYFPLHLFSDLLNQKYKNTLLHFILSSINCPTVICLPTVCYFSREKPLVKPTTPGSLSHIICLCDLLLFAFIFRSINPKTQKYFAALFICIFYFAFIRDLFIQSITILSRQLANFLQ